MSPSGHERITQIFLEICDLVEPDQRAALARLCGDDDALRHEVMQLLEFDSLEKPAIGTAFAGAIAEEALRDSQASTNERFGEYQILGILGEGGMGVVYRAKQLRPGRLVALKVLRDGLMTKSLQQRFEREVQVLGRLHHPGIAQIYDAGREDSQFGVRPYFAMELIEGQSITDYADHAALPPAERAKLMVKLCEAVQYAHEQGIIHRDLKPANVLVDRHGQPKILDFGVSRAIDQDPNQASLQTQTGVLIGTLAYMSSEQLRGDPKQIDTRSDIYALGVILFELLTGELPYPVAGMPLHLAVRCILEGEPRRAGTFDTTLRGDIEVIINSALASDKADRYATASELGADLTRYLRSQPIEAKRTHAWYVLKKSIYRHRIAASVAASFVALLCVALVVTYGLYRVAEDAVGEMTIANDLAAQARDQERLQRYSAQMQLGYDAYDAADLDQMRRMLENQRPAGGERDLRGFEWHWLDALSRGNRQSHPAHLATLCAIDITPDGQRIITAGWDGSIRIWEAESNELIATLDAHRRSVTAIEIAADGRRFASAGWDRAVRIWDLATLKPIRVIDEMEAIPTAVAFRQTEIASPSGRSSFGLAGRRQPRASAGVVVRFHAATSANTKSIQQARRGFLTTHPLGAQH